MNIHKPDTAKVRSRKYRRYMLFEEDLWDRCSSLEEACKWSTDDKERALSKAKKSKEDVTSVFDRVRGVIIWKNYR